MKSLAFLRTLQRIGLAPLVALIAAALLFTACYHYDNKYTSNTPQANAGILMLDKAALSQNPVIYLIDGWEAYPGLLAPEELAEDPLRSGKNVSIGQYTGFDFGNADKDPHGSATLVLTLVLPSEPGLYALELPEIYSAYRLYLNGELLLELGNPSPESYVASTGNRLITFTAQGSTELVLAMTDYSHIYSGLVYPPAFGEPDAVQTLLVSRLVIRIAVAALALLLSIFYLTTGFALKLRREEEAVSFLLYGLLCLCFIGYSCYPVVKALTSSGLWWYTLESFCYCAMLLLVMCIQIRLCKIQNKVVLVGPVVGGAVSCAALFTSIIAQSGAEAQAVWSDIVGIYFVFCAVYVTVTALYTLVKAIAHNPVMLCGALVFDMALVMDRLLPHHEPILTGWFAEWAGLVLVMCTGVLIVQELIAAYQQRKALAENMEHMQQLMDSQLSYYPLVLEQVEQAREARHDLRHHLSAIAGMVDTQRFDALDEYLKEYQSETAQPLVVYCQHPTTNMQLNNFAARARSMSIGFSAHVDMPEPTFVSDPDLFALLANLLENAYEAVCKLPNEQREITLTMRQTASTLAITVDNPYVDDIVQQGEQLYSQKQGGRPGAGTASVRRIAERYKGKASFTWEATGESEGVFHAGAVLSAERA